LKRVWQGVLAAVAIMVAVPAVAQEYPSHAIRLVVGFPPGGGPDIVGRIVAAKLSEVLGQAVVVETRAGGNGKIAGEVVAKSAPDGYTLLVGNDSLFVINPHLYKRMPLDPLKELAPVASLVSNGFFLAVNPSVPARTLPEFIEYARRANPPLQYGSGGNGGQHHPEAIEVLALWHTSRGSRPPV
jgi:tripartite-type tricarboxylate transporter receptor subunit TctC